MRHLADRRWRVAEQFITVQQAAEQLQVHPQTVRVWLREGKLKGRLIGRSHPRRHTGVPPGAQAVTAVAEGESEGEGSDEDAPRIIRTVQSDTKPMTPEEAVLELDLLGHGFFLFTNAETGRAAVVYRRKDGQIGLIDTT